ncbi:MAG: DNA repair protein RecO C-terminal domain-containing protein, partial [Ruminococcus sp.]|nr:DNA repair protein RecO C-terminal domain-containing protein [Ruminococcus sp.]
SLVKPCLEMRLTALSGYLPDLVMCRGCGVYAAPVMYFYPRTGEIACDRCGSLSGGAVALSEAALTALRHTVYAEENKLFSFALSDEGLEQLNRASEAYVQHRFEKEFKTLQFYHTMKEP